MMIVIDGGGCDNDSDRWCSGCDISTYLHMSKLAYFGALKGILGPKIDENSVSGQTKITPLKNFPDNVKTPWSQEYRDTMATLPQHLMNFLLSAGVCSLSPH